MKITAYPLYEGAAPLRPAPRDRGRDGFRAALSARFHAPGTAAPAPKTSRSRGPRRPGISCRAAKGEAGSRFIPGINSRPRAGRPSGRAVPSMHPRTGFGATGDDDRFFSPALYLDAVLEIYPPGPDGPLRGRRAFLHGPALSHGGPELEVVSPGDAVACELELPADDRCSGDGGNPPAPETAVRNRPGPGTARRFRRDSVSAAVSCHSAAAAAAGGASWIFCSAATIRPGSA